MVASHWYCDNKKETNEQLDIIFANNDASQSQNHQIMSTIPIIPQSHTISLLVILSNKHAAARCSKLATQLAVEYDDDKMIQWLKTFIDQKKCTLSSDNSDKENESIELTVANPLINRHKGRCKTK
ncbi:31831_t:CDS:2, partial [Gigaspora margarita]